MHCPARGQQFFDSVDGNARLRAGLPTPFSAALRQTYPDSVPRPSRDFHFQDPKNRTGAPLGETGLTLLSRSFP